MEYPPREILRVPDSMPQLREDVQSLTRTELGLMTPEEEESNEQLYHSVSALGNYSSCFSLAVCCSNCGWFTHWELQQPSLSWY